MDNTIFQRAKDIINNFPVSDELLHEKSELDINDDIYPGISELLKLVEAIKTTQGTRDVYLTNVQKEILCDQVGEVERLISAIESKLEDGQVLSKVDMKDLIQDNYNREYSDNIYNVLRAFLVMTKIASSTGRTGRNNSGLIKYVENADEYNQAVQDIKSEIDDEINKISGEGIDKDKIREDVRSRHESILYPAASDIVVSMEYEPVTLGKVRRLSGEWNTPDVIGYKIVKYEVFGGGDLEVISLEVKWSLTKQAIAEANSHQQLVNFSYIMVDDEFDWLDKNLIVEMQNKGIGLICKLNGEHRLVLNAKLTGTPKAAIDKFMLEAVNNQEDILEIKKELAKIHYNDYFKPLLP